jgi:hypothetical protein
VADDDELPQLAGVPVTAQAVKDDCLSPNHS